MSGRVCSVPECGRVHRARGYCNAHYLQVVVNGKEPRPIRERRGRSICDFPDCGRFINSGKWCERHNHQVRNGLPMRPVREYRKDPWVDRHGYVVHLNRRVHRVVMEEKLGRPLLPGENVHHINGDRTDNRPENLELWSTKQPRGQRVNDKVAWAVELLRLYAPELLAES